MARTNPEPGVPVNTSTMLKTVQAALTRANETNDKALKQAAENVLSALIVVLRHPTAELPVKVKPSIDLITKVTK